MNEGKEEVRTGKRTSVVEGCNPNILHRGQDAKGWKSAVKDVQDREKGY